MNLFMCFIWTGIVLLALAGIYLFMVCPRIVHRADRTPFLGVHYAHRGLFHNQTNAPENSLAAIREAKEAGYGIEIDVQLSRDEIPVIFHDDGLKRMCGIEGKVCEYTAKELQQMHLAGSGQTIPTLEQALKEVDGKVPLIIEYKVDRADTRVCRIANEILKEYRGNYCVESFYPFVIGWYRRHRPDILRGQLSRNFKRDGKKGMFMFLMTWLLTNFIARPDFIAYCYKDADNFSLRLCRRLGALLVAWTIKSQAEYAKARGQFDLFIFDSCRLKNP